MRGRLLLVLGGVTAVVALLVGLPLLQRPAAVEVQAVRVPVGDDVELDVAVYRTAGAPSPAPALLLAHGFAGERAQLDETARGWARRGLVVMTWSARGFGRSGGWIGLADPAREIADISALVDVLAEDDGVQLDGPGDPRVAIAGGSYGGGQALLAAIDEPRLDAVAAVAAWHDLGESLAPGGEVVDASAPAGVAAIPPTEAGAIGDVDGVWKAQWASLLFTAGARSGPGLQAALDAFGVQVPGRDVGLPASVDPLCGRFDPAVCTAYADSARDGRLTDTAAEIADRASPTGRLGGVTAPVLLVHPLGDDLFDPSASLANAVELEQAGVEVALRWLPGGHGGLGGPASPVGQQVAAWLDRHLLEEPRDDLTDDPAEVPAEDRDPLPVFAWVDRTSGDLLESAVLPALADARAVLLDGGTDGVTDGGDGQGEAEGDSRAGGDADQFLSLVLRADGSLRIGDQRDRDGATATMVHPAGGLPASLSRLPGLSGGGLSGDGGGGPRLDGLLPLIDIPGQALTFTTSSLGEDLVLLGQPVLSLRAVARDRDGEPVSTAVFVKLVDVAPGGQTTLVGATASPVRLPAVEGTGPQMRAPLGAVAHRVAAGHRLRVVLATTDQAFAADAAPAIVEVTLDGPTGLVVPLGAGDAPSASAPAALSLLLPVLLVALLAGVAVLAIRRDERRMAARIPSEEQDVVVRVTDLVKAYADGKVAVDGLDLEVRRGQVVGLLGPNGAGKTTTMRMLLGLAQPTSGRIELLGAVVRPGHPVLQRVGAIVEGPGFAPHLTGRQSLVSHWRTGASGAAATGPAGAAALRTVEGDTPSGATSDAARLEEVIAIADLGPAIDRPVKTYSHGMRQRLAIAQALLGDPDLLVLDEPTDGLDPEQIRAMRELLARLGDRGLTILVSSHLLGEVEQMCTHVAVVQQGRVVAAGPVADLVGATQSIVIRADDRAELREVLIAACGPEAIADEADGVAVDLSVATGPSAAATGDGTGEGGVEAADLIAHLVARGIRLASVTPRGRLEDAFLALTGTGATRRAEEGRAAQDRAAQDRAAQDGPGGGEAS